MSIFSRILGTKATVLGKRISTSNKQSTKIPMQTEKPSVSIQSKIQNPTLTKNYCFTTKFNSATELSDGSKLLRPFCAKLGIIDIKPTIATKKYKISIIPPHFSKGQEPIIQFLDEKEILENRVLSRGKIKKGKTPNHYIIEYKDNFGGIKSIEASEKDCLTFFQQNSLYM